MGLSYKGYNISLRPLKTDNQWQLELEKGSFITTRSIGVEMTLGNIEKYAFDQIDKLVEDEKKKT